MKITKFLVLLLITVSLISCKKEEAKPEVAKVPDVFTFTLNAVVKTDDDFQVFYKEDNDPQTPFDEESSVWSGGIKGSENAQDIVIKFPEGVYPTQVRFDFGQKKQDEILVNSMTMSFAEKSFILKGSDFFNYFIPDEKFVKIDKAASKIIPIEQEDGKFDPMLFSNSNLTLELTKLGQ